MSQSCRVKSLRYVSSLLVLIFTGILHAEEKRNDTIRNLQQEAEEKGYAHWGHWGANPERYAGYQSHSNRLVPIYTYGMTLDKYIAKQSAYRDKQKIKALYGQDAEDSYNPRATYCDQTDVYRLQRDAIAQGKKYIFLIVFDGMDWETTRAAATYYSSGNVYSYGRGNGLSFLDYRKAVTDYGFMVTSPHDYGTKVDVNGQLVLSPGSVFGGYNVFLGGQTPWEKSVDPVYLIGRNLKYPQAYTDSAAASTAMCCGVKTYCNAIGVDSGGKPVRSIAHTLQANGLSVGVVTSVPFSHATPASAYAHNVSRKDYQDIARDMLGQQSALHRNISLPGLDVVLGAGWLVTTEKDEKQGTNFEPGLKYIAESTLVAADARHGGRYQVVTRAAGTNGKALLKRAARRAIENKRPLLGLFGTTTGNLPYRTADGNYDPYVARPEVRANYQEDQRAYNPGQPYSEADIVENPTLADMTDAAIDVLSQNKRGFWVMIEAGDVDWASHANNIDNTIGAIRSGADAFTAVTDWIEKRDVWEQSAVIVTADHGHLFVNRDPSVFRQADSESGSE